MYNSDSLVKKTPQIWQEVQLIMMKHRPFIHPIHIQHD